MSKNIATLKSGSMVNSRSFKVVPFDRLYGFVLLFYSNFVPKTPVFEIFDFKICRDLENQVRVRQGH